jgi:hypothetical protein
VDEIRAERPQINRGRLKNNNPGGDPSTSPRCAAKAKSTGKACRAPGMKKSDGSYGRCCVHGGRSCGPVTARGLERSRKARWIHGLYAAESQTRRRLERKEIRRVIDDIRQSIAMLESKLPG